MISGTTEGPIPTSVWGIRTPIVIVSCFGFLGLQIFDDLAWTHNKGVILKKAHQHLYPLWYLRNCGISTQWHMNFYHGSIESVLSDGVTVWNGNTTAEDRKAIKSVIRLAGHWVCTSIHRGDFWWKEVLEGGQLHHAGPQSHWAPTFLPPAVWLMVLQHLNQDKQGHEQIIPTGIALYC